LRRHLDEVRVAPLYRTPAVSPIPQPDYLNTALLARSPLDAESLLALAKALERAAGRRRGERFGPRPLDVDLLWFGDRRSARPELTLPHPRLAERRFVLQPLADLALDLRVPALELRVRDLLAALPPGEIERIRG